MAGIVIKTLRSCPLASLLREAELRLLANCGRLITAERGETIMKVSQRMLQVLYGVLQEHGLCPPNIRAWLKVKRLLLAGEVP